jgi:hypothetical protein
MKSPWKTTPIKAIVWLTAEILLTIVGLDNLADYSEFVFEPGGFREPAIAALHSSTSDHLLN